MAIEIFDFPQNSAEWNEARLGIPTASRFKDILAKGKGLVRDQYMSKLAGEILTGRQAYNYTNDQIDRGHEQEPEARKTYALMKDADPELIGFIKNGPKGCSPDALLGNDGLLELKTREAHLQVLLIVKGVVPSGEMAQLQGQLWVSEREFVDYASYSPDIALFVKRVYRDTKYIIALKAEVERFNSELADMVEIVRKHRS